jgi:hypothetical protein
MDCEFWRLPPAFLPMLVKVSGLSALIRQQGPYFCTLRRKICENFPKGTKPTPNNS